MRDIFRLSIELRSRRFGASRILCKSDLNTHSQGGKNMEGTAGKIQTPTQWNPIGSRLTAPSPVLSPNSILPTFVSLLFLSRNINFGGRLEILF
jgi:hypothetical protein